MANAPSLLVCYGRQFYKLHELIQESRAHGLSKRVPITSIPEGMVNGASKLFAAHPDAIIKVGAEGKTLNDLAYELYEEGLLTVIQWQNLVEVHDPYWTGEELQPYDFVPECMLAIAMALSRSIHNSRLVKKYEIEFCMGIVGYSPFNGFQYVLGKGETELPEELAHLDGYVEPVQVVYQDPEPADQIGE